MDKNKLVDLICELNTDNPTDTVLAENKYKEIYDGLCCTEEDIGVSLKTITDLYFSSNLNTEWKYIRLSFNILYLLNTELESRGEMLSVQQSKNVKNCIQKLVKVGICTKLQPNLPLYSQTEADNPSPDIFLNYNLLKCTSFGLSELLKFPYLRILILPDSLKAILVAVYQICYCPLKKPTIDSTITEDIYNKLLNERELFLKILDRLRHTIHPGIFVKETMVIFQANAPIWFKKRVSKSLTNIIYSKNGVETIAVALLDGVTNDKTQTWAILEVFSKLILSCKNLPKFEENICKQLVDMLDRITDDSLIFETVLVHCVKSIYQADQNLVEIVFVKKILDYFLNFASKSYNRFDDITTNITRYVRITHALFVENSMDTRNLPLILLKPVISVLFRFYAVTTDTLFKPTNSELQDILIYSLKNMDLFALFDAFLFEITKEGMNSFRNDVILTVEENITVTYSDHTISYAVAENSTFILRLLKNEPKITAKFFGYLLNCLTNRGKYFKKANEDLLNLEVEFMNEYFERNLTVYKLLSDLAEDKVVQKHITDNPDDVIKYINDVLEKAIQTCTHKTTDYDTDDFQSIFTTIIILQLLVSNCSTKKLENYKILIQPLKVVFKESFNRELKELVGDILNNLEEAKSSTITEEVKSELDKAIEDTCDPLLPVRGHGLLKLTKLVEEKDKSIRERKQYILNIFQQNLKNEDSFIYLNAIRGLSALADVFPDTVLNILCDEYSDCSRKNEDGHEVRMKLGEALVRVTKNLGDMAPKYKSLLLNTFLMGAKDNDHLMRASSLSNLGEICRVLGYKLGTIITEVLVCVHAIIATDKSLEARRAAVTVIRQLFVGLDNETIAFLKDSILPIYRSLKQIYSNDRDEVMRLQAQLALEELNENVRKFVLPAPQLDMEKKIIVMK